MTRGVAQEQNLEKQMGCMAGFLQIFDRHQILAGKRLYSAKRLPPSTTVDSVTECEKTVGSPVVVRESERSQNGRSAPSPDRLKQSPAATELRSPSPAKAVEVTEIAQPASPLPLPVFEFKEGTRSSWKFSREAPRLSLDSRATFDAKGGLYPREIRTNAAILSANRRCESPDAGGEDDGDRNRRSPSVIARLMGLEPIQNQQQHPDPEPAKKSELRRSASESRVSKDLYQYRFVDGNAVQAKQSQQQSHVNGSGNVIRDNAVSNLRPSDPKLFGKTDQSPKAQPQQRRIGQRKSYFDTADFFPEPKQTAAPVSYYGEIEKRLRMRGIDESSKDLETLKQILEALQLKGLLHPRKATSQIDYRNLVYDNRNNFPHEESPIVVMRPARSPVPPPATRSPRFGSESPTRDGYRPRPAVRRNPNAGNTAGETLQAVSPRRDRGSRSQSPGRNTRSESCVKSPSRRRPLSIETPRRGNDVAEHRRVSPVSSPKLSSRSQQTANRSPRNSRSTVEIARKETRVEDESSTMSESTSTDTERAKMEEYKEGKSLLERCDKLLHSIAEITAAELQPSPVSVLDSSFYKDESSTSPIMKRSIHFKDQSIELDEESWVTALSSPIGSEISDGSSEDCDRIYVSEILRAFNYFPEDSDIFQLLEKQRFLKGNETSKVSKLQRRLIFDTITEILDQFTQLPPWKAVSAANASTGRASLNQVWAEFRRIRERDESEDLFEVICGVLRKDLNGDAVRGWGDFPVELSEAVLDIERLIFKDMIGETIRDLAALSLPVSCKPSPSCRKLVF